MTNADFSPWLPWRRFALNNAGQCLPKQLKSWLREPYSLTSRLRREIGEIEVQVTALYADSLGLELGQRLGVPGRSFSIVREVVLLHNDQLCFSAKTVIPLASMVRDTRRLRRWQNRSLGDFLFRSPNARYSSLEFSYGVVTGESIWARRRCHYLYNKPIMVCEYFPESSLCQWFP